MALGSALVSYMGEKMTYETFGLHVLQLYGGFLFVGATEKSQHAPFPYTRARFQGGTESLRNRTEVFQPTY